MSCLKLRGGSVYVESLFIDASIVCWFLFCYAVVLVSFLVFAAITLRKRVGCFTFIFFLLPYG